MKSCPFLLLVVTFCFHGSVLSFHFHSVHTTSPSFLARKSNGQSSQTQSQTRATRKRRFSISPLQLVSDEETTGAGKKKDSGDDELEKLSDLDARVLQSLLQDENLDLKSEQNLKKMLEKGVKKKETPKERGEKSGDDANDSEFSSTFFKAINDNELWNSVVAKADEIVESAKIYVQNRIERDAKLLASVGLFAWQRAIKDVGRALPSAGKSGAAMAKKMRDSLFLLSNNSSFVEYQFKDNFILPPSKYSEGVETSVFEELNTPMDEIKSVTAAIRDILSGKSVSSDRGLRSVAKTRGDRQKMAYERKKNTVLKREKEGVDAKFARTASSVTDTIWELKREMEVEGNEAGYRAKDVQQRLEGTLESARMLGESPNRVLRGIGERIFGATTEATPQIAGDSSDDVAAGGSDPLLVLTKADLDEERARLAASLEICLEMPGKTWLTPSTVSSSEKSDVEAIKGFNNETSPEDGNQTFVSEQSKDEVDQKTEEEIDFQMVAAPIATMVLTRNDLEAQCNDDSEIFENQDEIIAELREMKKTVDMIASQAAASAGFGASEALRNELLGTSQEDGGSLLSSLDEIVAVIDAQAREAELKQAREAELKQAMEAELKLAKEVELEQDSKNERNDFVMEDVELDIDSINYMPQGGAEVKTVTDVEVEVEVVDTTKKEQTSGIENNLIDLVDVQMISDADFKVISSASDVLQTEATNGDQSNPIEYATVELITDDQVEVMSGGVKDLNSAAFDDARAIETDDARSEEKRPILVTLTLRTIDIILFILEKTLTVGLPGLFTAWSLFSERTEMLNRKGLGKEGWDELENFSDAKKRY